MKLHAGVWCVRVLDEQVLAASTSSASRNTNTVHTSKYQYIPVPVWAPHLRELPQFHWLADWERSTGCKVAYFVLRFYAVSLHQQGHYYNKQRSPSREPGRALTQLSRACIPSEYDGAAVHCILCVCAHAGACPSSSTFLCHAQLRVRCCCSATCAVSAHAGTLLSPFASAPSDSCQSPVSIYALSWCLLHWGSVRSHV